jgi:hypothetical protein
VGRLSRCFAGALFVLLAAPAGASPVVVDFSGQLTSVSDPQGLLPAVLTPGALLTGTLSYEPGALCQPVFQQPSACEYIVSPSSLTLWLHTAPVASVEGRAYVFVEDGPLVDSFSASVGASATPSSGSAPAWLSADFQLSDPGATALAGTALPVTLDLSGFSQHTFDAGGCYGGACTGNPLDQFQIAGTILSMQTVPEPGTGMLLAFGVLTLGRWGKGGRRGSRRAR